MHPTTVKNPIHLVHREDGIVHTFKSFESLAHNWPFIRRLSIGTAFKIEWEHAEWLREWHRLRTSYYNPWPARYHEYILRSSVGDNIDPDTVRAAYNASRPYIPRWGGYPNPRQPGHKRGSYRWFRQPRTTQERRWAKAWDDEEFAPKTRCSRNFRNLPNAWDDYTRRDADDRSWKRHRKHQWKE